ncbi:MAG: peptidase S41 [Bacteroidaceae bacterium]|nr:peptidase S41 [Bacteroidaceae bacterium]
MKSKYCVIIPLIIMVVSSFFSACGKDRWEEYYPITLHNLWIESIMRVNYLWNDELADEDDLTSSYFLNSVSFLEKNKYGYDQVSYVDTAYSAPITDYGYELSTNQINDSAYMALITYIEPTSVSANVGLQRGEWIMKIDGEFITSPRLSLLSDGDAHELMIGHYITINLTEGDSEEGEGEGVIIYNRMVNLPAAKGYYHNDLPVVSIINGHVGYMLYTDIAAKNQQQVATASNTLSVDGITDMVLDLRYTATGDVSGFQYLASVLAPYSALGSKLATVQYAESRHHDSSLSFLTTSELENGTNLNLGTLYILTSSFTSGPAEILINCLQSVMNVVVIGQKTKGIGVACESFLDPVNDQLLRLAACHITDINGNADYVDTGITPDYIVDQFSPIEGILPFGNPQENLLAKALELIEK